MRLRTSLSLTVVTAAALACGPVPSAAGLDAPPAAAPGADRRPGCADPDARDFPLRTRVHGGPDVYETGGADGTWYLDLTNTTAHPCGGIHPVVVLVDGKRQLRPSQVRLEFFEGTRAHPVSFERTDDDELVGAFDGFPGFTVAPGRTLRVKVRLTVTSAAVAPNDVVANAAVVHRHRDDGDWVGQSNDYRFRIDGTPDAAVDGTDTPATATGPASAAPSARASGAPSAPASAASPASSAPDPSAPDSGAATDPGGSGGDSGHEGGDGDAGAEGEGGAPGGMPSVEELARTGPGTPHDTGLLIGGLLLVAGGTLLITTARFLRGRG
ncbi:hypothetical protein [Streptomyces sp. NPDC005907]|uniref:hypothetical protein n=1 Tax=Streptomyces sp. NPDC005907 TaxID=3154571 RepID=UPI0033EF2467